METIKKRKETPITNVSKSIKSDVERLSVNEYAYHFIKEQEWFRTEAYRDHKQRSIWFGTVSHKWQVLTKEEIYKAYNRELNPRINKVVKERPNKNSCQQAALVSLLYNCPSCYRNMQKNWVSEWYWKAHVYAGGKKMWWLVKRRNKERALYTTCD